VNFKVGDTVVVTQSDSPFFFEGSVGIVLSIDHEDNEYAVKFFAGNYDRDCEGTWHCIDEELRLATKLDKLLLGDISDV
jgi:hypothetical protein